MNQSRLLSAALAALLLAGCLKPPGPVLDQAPVVNPTDMTELVVDPAFDYATTQPQSLTLQVQDAQDMPIDYAPIELYRADGTLMARGQTDAAGRWSIDYPVPTHAETLLARVLYPGIPEAYQLSVQGQGQTFVLGGQRPGQAPQVEVYDWQAEPQGAGKVGQTTDLNSKFVYLGPYNSEGVPSYLTLSRDMITQDILDLVANSLPEGRPVPDYNPQYIAESISADTRLIDSAELWVTFVHEGAGYRNVLGYYTYDLTNPPASVDDIDSLYILFPNVSFAGAGGGLQTGDKVYLGSFAPNTGVGWFLAPNAWSIGLQRVNYPGTGTIKFSNKDLNDFTAPEHRSHVVLLKNDARELLLLGMEDIDRPAGDRDFNDAVFYIAATPYTALDTTGVALAKTSVGADDDNDEIINVNDDYPLDPNRSFDLYFPGEDAYGTVAFEDLWPYRGDYDMNDMVIDYNYHLVTNTANRVVEMNATFVIKALGAGMSNGFAFMLDIPAAEIDQVTGSQLLGDRVTLSPNGVESGQRHAVMVAFDDGHALMSQRRGQFVNTVTTDAYLTPDTVRMTVTFNQPQRLNDLGSAPFNPFIFTQRGRGYEVHLPDLPPSDLADPSLFATGNDTSDPAVGRYYKDANHLPWALHIPLPFDYPIEEASIIQGHLRFADWAQSTGSIFTDWYLSKSGYRSHAHLYQR